MVKPNPVSHPFLIRDKERRSQMQPLATSPAIALGSNRARAVDRWMRLLERLGEESVVVQAPEFALVGKRTAGGPSLEDDLSTLVVALVVLILVDTENLVRVLQKSPADA